MRKAALLLIAIALCSSVFAEDNCRDILSAGFFNVYTSSNAESRDRAMYAQLCSSTFSEAKTLLQKAESSGASGSLGVSFGLFGLNAGSGTSAANSLTEERFNQWKASSCSTNTLKESSSASEYLMQKTVAESVVNAWSSCMQKREGLTCWPQPLADSVLVNVNWKKTSLNPTAKVTSSFLSKGVVAEFDDVAIGKLLPGSYLMNLGVLQIPLTRTQDKNVVASINLVHDGVNYSCSVFVPGVVTFPLTKPTLAQQIQTAKHLGCEAKAAPSGSSCNGGWPYSAPAQYRVCTVEIAYTDGPTENATMALASPTPSGGRLVWNVPRNETLFGAGRWVYGDATVTFVPGDRNARDDGRGCDPTTLTQK